MLDFSVTLVHLGYLLVVRWFPATMLRPRKGPLLSRCARGIFRRVDYYTVEEASKILGRSKSTIRKYLNAGELEGEYTDDGWQVSQASVHERKENLERGMKRAGAQSAEDAVERLAMQLGRVQAIKELTGLSEANVKAERDRLREALDEERERRIRAEAEVAFLKAPKPQSWVSKFFGL